MEILNPANPFILIILIQTILCKDPELPRLRLDSDSGAK